MFLFFYLSGKNCSVKCQCHHHVSVPLGVSALTVITSGSLTEVLFRVLQECNQPQVRGFFIFPLKTKSLKYLLEVSGILGLLQLECKNCQTVKKCFQYTHYS